MKSLPVKVFSLCLALFVVGRAQEPQSTGNAQVPEDPPSQEGTAVRSFPLEVAGYIDFRYLNDDALQEHNFFRQYSASLFLSKTLGRWRFHSEFNADTAPEYDSDGIHLFPRRPSLSVKLDSAFVNYNARDWLQVQAGLLFIPTYWRTHRYQSTTLTVDEPLIDQNVFPTALKGAAVYGDKYWGDGGMGLRLHRLRRRRSSNPNSRKAHKLSGRNRREAVGGKLTSFDVPTQQPILQSLRCCDSSSAPGW